MDQKVDQKVEQKVDQKVTTTGSSLLYVIEKNPRKMRFFLKDP